ncbi:hypothetical protein, partial [Dickeya dadantii]|uniref:hypothetical protein n=1 Tax=Dickeya dadantii TaxID=204038 RepID=UPI003F5E1486
MAGGALSVTADGLANSGTLQGRQAVGLTVGRDFSQTADGVLTSGGTVTVTAGGVATAGALTAQGLALSTGRWRHQGAVTLGGDGRLVLDELDNGGTLRAAGAWEMQAATLSNGGTLQGGRLALRGDTLSNDGQLGGLTQLALTLSGAAVNRGTLAGERVTLTADSLDNGGTLLGMDALTLAIAGTA